MRWIEAAVRFVLETGERRPEGHDHARPVTSAITRLPRTGDPEADARVIELFYRYPPGGG